MIAIWTLALLLWGGIIDTTPEPIRRGIDVRRVPRVHFVERDGSRRMAERR